MPHARGFADVTTDMDLNSPAVNVDINRDQAAAQGVSVQSIETALGASFGGEQISTLYASDAEYWVMLELEPQYQNDPSAINLLYVSSSNTAAAAPRGITGAPGSNAGARSTATNPSNAPRPAPCRTIVPLNAVTSCAHGHHAAQHQSPGPAAVGDHLFQSAAGLCAVRCGDGHRAGARPRPTFRATVQGQFQGTAQAFQSSLSNIGILLTIAIMTVYIILGILYESFVHPLTILSGLPSAAVGALITLAAVRHSAQPLCLCRHDHADRHRQEERHHDDRLRAAPGARENMSSPDQAIFEAALVRFRPIMMTTMAALLGTLPVAIGFGAGSEARRPLGLAVVGGLVGVPAADALHHAR